MEKDLDAAVRSAGRGKFWGSVLVGRGNKVLFEKGYGDSDYGRRANGPETLFELASVSKQFTAAAALRLVQDGSLTLETPLGVLFEETPGETGAITVHQLLTHTSGLPRGAVLGYASTADRDELVRRTLAGPTIHEPGEAFLYSNAGYALLAAVVEVAAGEAFEAYAERVLFGPAELDDTGFIGDSDLDPKRTSTRRSKGTDHGTAVDWHYGWGYRGMGGIVSTANDLHRWDRALTTDVILDEAHRTILYEVAQGGYSCGWYVSSTERGTRRAWHTGGVQGYACAIERYLDEDVFIAVLSNGETPVVSIASALAKTIFPPLTVTVEFDLRGEERNSVQAVVLDGDVRMDVSKRRKQVELAMTRGSKPRPNIQVSMPLARARGLARELRNMVRDGHGEDPDGGGIESAIYFAVTPSKSARQELEDLELTLMPRYSGIDFAGQRITDERITLVAETPTGWPLITRLPAAAASQLADSIDAAVGD